MLLGTYYAQNYAGIIGASLLLKYYCALNRDMRMRIKTTKMKISGLASLLLLLVVSLYGTQGQGI